VTAVKILAALCVSPAGLLAIPVVHNPARETVVKPAVRLTVGAIVIIPVTRAALLPVWLQADTESIQAESTEEIKLCRHDGQ
jgi:hypothetical protein